MSEAPVIPEAAPAGGGAPAAAPVAAPAAEANWRDAMDVSIRDHHAFANMKDLTDFGNQHINQAKLIGGEKIPAPQEGWGESEWADHHTRLGRPQDPKDYDLSASKDVAIPEGMTWSDDLQTAMIAEMHAGGANSALVNRVIGKYKELQGEAFSGNATAVEAAKVEQRKMLENAWGASFAAKKELANTGWRELSGENAEALFALKAADGTSLVDDPAFLNAMAELGSRMGEHGLVGPKTMNTTLSPGEAKAQIAELMSGENLTILSDESHPQNAVLQKKKSALFAAAYPEEK